MTLFKLTENQYLLEDVFWSYWMKYDSFLYYWCYLQDNFNKNNSFWVDGASSY